MSHSADATAAHASQEITRMVREETLLRHARRAGAFCALLLAVLTFGFIADRASAATFVVNDERDLPDLDTVAGQTPDTFCDAEEEGGANCTLRAAIQEANDTAAVDAIHFAPHIQNTTLTLQSEVPLFAHPTTLDGCNGAAATNPCVGVRARTPGSNQPRLSYVLGNVAAGSTIAGMAITNGTQGVFGGGGAAPITYRNNWFGIKLDGSAEGNQTGIKVTGDGTQVGGTAPTSRNVFGNNGIGIDVFTADNVNIQGNRFGTRADGATPALNATGIRLEGRGHGGVDRPLNTTIGGYLPQAAQNTPACDDACNLFAGNGSSGEAISLGFDTQNTAAAEGTTIAGNYIGVGPTGSTAQPQLTGIEVGQADGVTIGGVDAGSRNLITAAQDGIHAGYAGVKDLTIRANWLGTDVNGATRLGALSRGAIHTLSLGGDPHTITSNLVAIGGGWGIRVRGRNASVQSNYVGIGASGTEDIGSGGDSSAILLSASFDNETVSNTVAFNTVGNAGRAGIELRGTPANKLHGNSIGTDGLGHAHGNARFGVLVTSPSATIRAADNVIGGDTFGLGNEIANNPEAGIAIEGAASTGNVIGNLSGRANGDSAGMIDLGLDGRGNAAAGPNGGVQAPEIVGATRHAVFGTGEPGAVVRIYEKGTADVGEVRGIDGSITVDSDGFWMVLYGGSPQDVGQRLVASQTASSGGTVTGTSELSEMAVTVAGEGTAGAPETTIAGATLTNDATPAFELGASEPAAGFLCRVDGGNWHGCPASYALAPALAEGQHKLEARAIGYDGDQDSTPAEHTFTIDLTAPGAPQIDAGPNGETDDPTPRFEFSGEPDGGFACSIDGGAPVACDGGSFTPASPLAAGPHTFSVVQRDGAGNESAAATRAFTVTGTPDDDGSDDGGDGTDDGIRDDTDRLAPETTITKAPKRKLTAKGSRKKVKFKFAADEAGATFTCWIDAKTIQNCGSPLKLKLRPGKHLFAVAATDIAGNADKTPASYRLRIR